MKKYLLLVVLTNSLSFGMGKTAPDLDLPSIFVDFDSDDDEEVTAILAQQKHFSTKNTPVTIIKLKPPMQRNQQIIVTTKPQEQNSFLSILFSCCSVCAPPNENV